MCGGQMKFVSVEQNQNIAFVTFDRGAFSNLLNLELIRELTKTANILSEEKELLAIILLGRSENFCMGFDLGDQELKEVRSKNINTQRSTLAAGSKMGIAWENLPALTISAINGWCVGGGLALAVSTDLRIVSSDTTMYVPEVERALNMSWGAVPRITNLVGPAKAKQLIMLAQKISSEKALKWGLVDEIASEKDVKERSRELGKTAASMPPLAFKICKQNINSYANALAGVSSNQDLDQFLLTFRSKDFEKSLVSFKQKKPTKFSGN